MDPLRTPERPRPSFLLLAGLLVLATTLVTPVVSGSAVPEEPKPTPAAKPVTPGADARPADAKQELERLTRRIEERARLSEADTAELQAAVQALTSRVQPNEAEIERLSRELAKNAAEMASRISEGVGQGAEAAARRESRAEIEHRMDELRKELHRTIRDSISEDDTKALREKARALAEGSRPTAEEMRRIRELTRQLAAESMPDAREMSRVSREATDQLREAMHELREALRVVRDELRQAGREAGRGAFKSRDATPTPD